MMEESARGGIRIVRSRRKTISIEMRPEGLLVRAPVGMSDAQIEAFLQKHRRWIAIHAEKLRQRQRELEAAGKLSAEEIRELAEQALQVIPERVKYYASRIGVTYGRITIRNQRTRWGSRSTRGNLNFNCLLMLTPPEVIDSVVVHELCHRKVMNHSADFYEEVLRVYPEYRKWERWLKENGDALMRRMTGS